MRTGGDLANDVALFVSAARQHASDLLCSSRVSEAQFQPPVVLDIPVKGLLALSAICRALFERVRCRLRRLAHGIVVVAAEVRGPVNT